MNIVHCKHNYKQNEEKKKRNAVCMPQCWKIECDEKWDKKPRLLLKMWLADCDVHNECNTHRYSYAHSHEMRKKKELE